MQSISYFVFLLSILCLATNCTYDHLDVSVSAEKIGGYYDNSLTLSNWNEGTDYIISKDLDLLEGTLTIKPGTTIEIEDNVAININGGSIKVEGNVEERIVLKGKNDNVLESWAGIRFFSTNNVNTLSYVLIEGAGIMIGTDSYEGRHISLHHVQIKNCECGIYEYKGSVDVDDTVNFENVEHNICH